MTAIRHFVTYGPDSGPCELVLRRLPWWVRALSATYDQLDEATGHRLCNLRFWAWIQHVEDKLGVDFRVAIDRECADAACAFLWNVPADCDCEDAE